MTGKSYRCEVCSVARSHIYRQISNKEPRNQVYEITAWMIGEKDWAQGSNLRKSLNRENKRFKNDFLRPAAQQSLGKNGYRLHKLGALLVTAEEAETVRHGFSPQRASVLLFLLKKKNQAA